MPEAGFVHPRPQEKGAVVAQPPSKRAAHILSPEALAFLAELHERFDPVRRDLLMRREKRYAQLVAGAQPDFLAETRAVRDGSWQVAAPPEDLRDRRVEITGPTDAKMMINALNSGAKVFMADFEDANSPTWSNLLEGQANLVDAAERKLSFTSPEGKEYRLNPRVAALMVRPRGWHLPERHVVFDGRPMSGSLFDFGLHAFHCANRSLAGGSGPYYYLPKTESHLEARLWNDVFRFAEDRLKLRRGAFRATVLIETILAAFEMQEILHELRERSVGLNAGRWDYLFSIIKKFRERPELHLPDRAQLTMTVPFMRAYTQLLVRSCHARGAHAMGGMAAYIPSRKDPVANEKALAKVREDKEREATDGFDGTWVAHPDLVAPAMEVFDRALGNRPNQVDRQRADAQVTAKQLLDFRLSDARTTEAGLRANVDVGIQYIESWLRGVGAAGIHNLMEDAATAEISRSQVWHWIHQGERLPDGRAITKNLVESIVKEEVARLRAEWGPERTRASRLDDAVALFAEVALAHEYPDFLTIPAYERLEEA